MMRLRKLCASTRKKGGSSGAKSSSSVRPSAPAPSANPAPSQAPVMYQQPPPTVVYQPMPPPPVPEQPLWARVLVPASLALSVSAGVAFLYKTYVMGEGPFGNGRRPGPYFGARDSYYEEQRAIGDVQSSAAVEDLRRALEEQRQAISELKDVVASSRGDSASAVQAIVAEKVRAQETSDIKSELAAIKTLLLASHVNQMATPATPSSAALDLSRLENVTTPISARPPIDTPQKQEDKVSEKKARNPMDDLILAASASASPSSLAASSEVAPEEKQEEDNIASEKEAAEDNEKEDPGIEHMKKSREALAHMVSQSNGDQQALSKAVNILIMYLNNLIKGPEVPRFRRIAKQNSNYLKILKPIEGHAEFLVKRRL